MSWIIPNRKDAELAGADIEHDRVLLAVTPNYVAERYNDFVDQDPATPDDSEDAWDSLPEDRKNEILKEVDAYCDRHLRVVDDAIQDIFLANKSQHTGTSPDSGKTDAEMP